jgi:hypothetical protein
LRNFAGGAPKCFVKSVVKEPMLSNPQSSAMQPALDFEPRGFAQCRKPGDAAAGDRRSMRLLDVSAREKHAKRLHRLERIDLHRILLGIVDDEASGGTEFEPAASVVQVAVR